MTEWKPIETAPKDGTIIIAAFGDWSGCQFVRWGEDEDHNEAWFHTDWSSEASSLYEWWIPCPPSDGLSKLSELRGWKQV